MNKSSVLVIAVLTAWSKTSPAFAQANVMEGSVFPMQYDSHGVRHFYTNGYSGPLTPGMPGEAKDTLRLERKSGLQATSRTARQTAAISASARHKTSRAGANGSMASATRTRSIR
jgi:hypothetical protein